MSALSELEVSTQNRFMPLVTNQIWEDSPVLHRIFRVAKEGDFGLALPSYDGRAIVEPIEIGTVTGAVSGSHGAYSTSDTWVPANEDILAGATYTWKMYHTTIKINHLTVEENKGISRILDIAAIKMRNAAKVLKKDLITDFYTKTKDGDVKMVGVNAVADGDPGVETLIGGIDAQANAYWRGYLDDESGAPIDLTWDVLNAMYHDTKKYGNGDKATLIVTTPGVLENYENLLTKTVVVGAGTSAATQHGIYVTQPLGRKVIDGGFEAFSFKGIPMVSDPLLPDSGYLYFLNENYMHWRVLKNFTTTGWKDQRDVGKDYAQLSIFGYGAMTYSSPRKLGKIIGLNEA